MIETLEKRINTLYRADCRTILERIADRSIDLIYIDPPWITLNSIESDKELHILFWATIRQFKRILKPSGQLLIHVSPEMGDGQMTPILQEVFGKDSHRPPLIITHSELYKANPSKTRARYEQVLHFVRSSQYEAEFKGAFVINDIDPVEVCAEDANVTNQRPLTLMHRLLDFASQPNDIVLDAFCGTGSMLVVAQEMNRRWIGVDIEEQLINIAQQRIGQVLSTNDFKRDDEVWAKEYFQPVHSSSMPKFFISYSRKDSNDVDKFCNELDDHIISYWRDRKGIEVGDDWENKILAALNECDALVLFLSPNAVQSDWVKREYSTIKKKKKCIYPIYCQNVNVPDDFTGLKKYQHVSFDERDQVIDKLRRFIRKI